MTTEERVARIVIWYRRWKSLDRLLLGMETKYVFKYL